MYVAMILLLGTIFTFIARKIKVSSIFFLVLVGMVLGFLDLVEMPLDVVSVLGILVLSIVVFESVATLRSADYSLMKGTGLFIILYIAANIVIMAFAARFIFSLFSISLSVAASVIFASVISSIDETVSISVLGDIKSKVVKTLELEAIMSTPFALLVPLLLLSIEGFGYQGALFAVSSVIVPVLIGFAIGKFAIFFLKIDYFKDLSYLLIISCAVISYALCDIFHFPGVIAVATFAFVFSRSDVVKKEQVESQASLIGHFLLIFMFILLGSLIIEQSFDRTFDELIVGSLLFFVYIILRGIAVFFYFRRSFRPKEKLFMALSVPKGVDVAVIVLLLITSYSSQDYIIVKNVVLLFVLYSITLSTIITALHKKFLY